MNHFFKRYPNIKIKDYDLIFFPILQDEHFYLICINKKEQGYEVIDNIKVGRAVTNLYGGNVRKMKRHFVKYLKEKELTLLANKIKGFPVSYLSLRWQTFKNQTDCGIFLMRHMETYKGTLKNWTTQLRTERTGQKGQIDNLITKYVNVILTSHLNEKSHLILEEANSFYKKITTETISKIVIGESAGIEKQKRFKIPRTVQFLDDCRTSTKKAEEAKQNEETTDVVENRTVDASKG
ncbi:hypothetical protein POM88_045491 [Heracleum sosnowskyi]|uniref:Ubiquitin-like protease family profile domain-containing protein n=1 Tax=Heracleum sosnowskyi TaxID=360622 RepID=A0AAD8H7J8_9APIA|nr:hypothetical protein POM88_045491 [Heracleum sosnowskyi]